MWDIATGAVRYSLDAGAHAVWRAAEDAHVAPRELGIMETGGDAAAHASEPALVDRALAAGLTAGNVSALAAYFPTGGLEEVENEMRTLNKKFGFYVKSNQQSRETVTQTNYQIDFSNAFSKLR